MLFRDVYFHVEDLLIVEHPWSYVEILVSFFLELDLVASMVICQLVLEGVRAKQLQDALLLEKHTMEEEIQQASVSLNFYEMKSARIEDQVCITYFVWNNLLIVI